MEKYESPTIESVGMGKEVQETWYAENVFVVGEVAVYATLAGVMHGALFLVVLVTAALVLVAGKIEE